jgi:hypothetical protein
MLIQKKNIHQNARNLNSIQSLQQMHLNQGKVSPNKFSRTASNFLDSQWEGSSDKKLLGAALNRHEINSQYHSKAYPYFMKANGPFKVYNHAKQKGRDYETNLNFITE